MRITWHAPGPPHHGAVRHAQDLTRRLIVAGHHVCPWPIPGDVTHVQFTDALFGPDIARAAAAFAVWRRMTTGPVVATLHDLPSGRDARADRRRAGYREVLSHVDVVVVSGEHERELAADLASVPIAVVPLPLPQLPPRDGRKPSWADRPTLGVLGFIYPGKGHELALELARGTDLTVVAIGDVSPGHESLLASLGDEMVVTGALSDGELHRAICEVTVPLSHNPGVSASASLMTWIAAGRRPLVDCGAFAREVLTRWPQAVAPLTPESWQRAMSDPSSTRSTPPHDVDVVAGHLAAYQLAAR